jgi:hypothetical protein
MMAIELRDVLQALRRSADAIMEAQVVGAGPDRGGVVRADWGIAEPTGTCGLAATCGLLYLAMIMHREAAPSLPENSALLDRLDMAADYLLAVQRPSGLMDLRDCNYDSSPDAGFAVQALCPVIELGRQMVGRDARWDSVLERIETIVRRATIGMLTGGFHTPNHRWVMCAAMAWAGDLFPEIEVEPVISAYVAEGYDVDTDGAFIEKSAGVYDAICDRSLLTLWERRGDRAALEAALANLELNLHMLHPDGTIETGASRRQDYGTRPVPATLALPLLMAYGVRQDDRYVGAAELLWGRSRGDAAGIAGYMMRCGVASIARSSGNGFPFDFARTFPHLGLWRMRRGRLSATAFRGGTRLLTLVFGEAELSALKISQSYFGVGRFVGDTLSETPTGCVIRSEGNADVHRPGYDLPLGRAVDRQRWFETRKDRLWRALPRCVSELTVDEAAAGLDLTYRTLDGMDGVTAQIALDFAPGGVWQTADTCLKPVAGQVIFLRGGYGTMRYGHDVIELGPGADSHRMWAMRDAEPAPGHVRVLIPLETPVEHRLTIRCRREP